MAGTKRRAKKKKRQNKIGKFRVFIIISNRIQNGFRRTISIAINAEKGFNLSSTKKKKKNKKFELDVRGLNGKRQACSLQMPEKYVPFYVDQEDEKEEEEFRDADTLQEKWSKSIAPKNFNWFHNK